MISLLDKAMCYLKEWHDIRDTNRRMIKAAHQLKRTAGRGCGF